MKARILAISLLAVHLSSFAQAELEGSYAAAIKAARLNSSDKVDAGYVEMHLRGAMFNWTNKPSYKDIRRLTSAVAAKKDQVRLEIGNEGSGRYRVIWVINTKQGAEVY